MSVSALSWFWNGGAVAVKAPRDVRVDAFRGLALLMIFINHVPANPVSAFTLGGVAFSDAAELFVIFAGYATALAFASVERDKGYFAAGAKLVARAGKLYTTHLVLFLFVAAFIAYASLRTQNPLYFELVNIVAVFNDPAAALFGAVTLTYQPYFLDILPLYIVLLTGFPLVAWLAWRRPALLLAASIALYLLATHTGLNLPNRLGGEVWFFNPFAWQLLFVIGALAGVAATCGVSLPSSRILLVLAALYLAFGAVMHIQPLQTEMLRHFDGWLVDPAVDVSKTNLSLWRLASVLALLYVLAHAVPATARWLSSTPVSVLAACGRQSLPVFGVGVVLSVISHAIVMDHGTGWEVFLVVNTCGILALIGTGLFMEWYRMLTSGKTARSGERRPA
jgi:hypothetical protein